MMHATGFTPVLLLVTAMGLAQACAQAAKETKAPPPVAASDNRYFTSLSGLMDDQADSVLKETRLGSKVTAAVLDVCFPAIGNTDRKDRFVATLNIDGQKLTGSTTTHDGKQPVTINLVRKPAPNGTTFEGKISIGNRTSNVSSMDNTDIGEKEFKETQDGDDPIITAPSDFTTASPEAIAVRIKPENVLNFVNGLRGQSVEISLMSLLPSCNELRKDEQVIRMNIDPERAADFIAKMKTSPGVMASGWTGGKIDMERTVRFATTSWRENGKLNKDKLATALSATIAKALSATALTTKWNDNNGELKLSFRRPNAAFAGLNLTQTIEFSVLVAGDRSASNDQLLLWISYPVTTTSDEGSTEKLKLFDPSDSDSEDNVPAEDGDTLTAIARDLKARRWDTESNSWK
jgi:hypothetical protein